jgi:hypothetical protein
MQYNKAIRDAPFLNAPGDADRLTRHLQLVMHRVQSDRALTADEKSRR